MPACHKTNILEHDGHLNTCPVPSSTTPSIRKHSHNLPAMRLNYTYVQDPRGIVLSQAPPASRWGHKDEQVALWSTLGPHTA
jgi:hypothetical protein